MGGAVAAGAVALLLAGCAGEPAAIPTIGSPAPTPTASSVLTNRGAQLSEKWDLTGADLPDDWPDIPLPQGTEVTTAYAIGSEPRRTWTATFSGDRGTALDLAAPVVKSLRARAYVPIAEYVGAAETNTGLYSFAAPLFAVYVVLGEDDGRPNLVITVRGSASDPASPEPTLPHNGSSLSPRATVSPEASGSPADGTASASPTDTTDSTRSATPRAS